MKIMYIDSSLVGHHILYLNAIKGLPDETVAILPEKDEDLGIRQYNISFPDGPKRKLSSFQGWIKAVKQIVDKEKPDIVHFLMGDDFYRFFGAGLRRFSNYKVVVTLHWMRGGLAGKTSTRCIAKASDIIIVHSDYIKRQVSSYGVSNVEHIEYPQFGTFFYTISEARDYWKLDHNIPVIVCIGNTRQDKGLDILLGALSKVDRPFQLLIAGKEAYFNKAFIEEKIAEYKDQVRLYLVYLTDKELAMAVSAADIVVLPYRRKFDGASGPLGDGVVHNKMIVGPNHGNLGNTIEKNHLGYTFETENMDSLANVLNKALPFVEAGWKPDDLYSSYRENLSLDKFKASYKKIYEELVRADG